MKENSLYLGDILDILSRYDDGSIDLIIADPPYGKNYVSNGGPRATDPNIRKRTKIIGDEKLNPLWFRQMYRVLKNTGACYVFASWDTYTNAETALKCSGFALKTTLVWDKGNCGMGDLRGDYGNQTELILFAVKGRHILNGNRDRNILKYQRPSDAHRLHPMQKPVQLLEYLIERSSNPRQIVLDPFMGSGSTGEAAIRTERVFVGIEIDAKYYFIAKERISQYSRL